MTCPCLCVAPSGASRELPVATKQFFDALREVGLDPSLDAPGAPGKTVALASHVSLRQRLEVPMARIGVHCSARALNLGVDHRGAGRISGRSIKAKRLAAVVRRAAWLRHLKAMGGKVCKVV